MNANQIAAATYTAIYCSLRRMSSPRATVTEVLAWPFPGPHNSAGLLQKVSDTRASVQLNIPTQNTWRKYVKDYFGFSFFCDTKRASFPSSRNLPSVCHTAISVGRESIMELYRSSLRLGTCLSCECMFTKSWVLSISIVWLSTAKAIRIARRVQVEDEDPVK